jgi:hypothetical protein
MEAKQLDTIMAEVKKNFNPCPKHGEPAPTYEEVIAEIPFKVGRLIRDEDLLKLSDNADKLFKAIKQQGIKEVVDWVGNNSEILYRMNNVKMLGVGYDLWQAFLKEHGLGEW